VARFNNYFWTPSQEVRCYSIYPPRSGTLATRLASSPSATCADFHDAGRSGHEIARNKDAQGFTKNKQAAREGGNVAGTARRQLERKSGRKVVTANNYLIEKPKRELPPKSK
jgi:hypothetical protein